MFSIVEILRNFVSYGNIDFIWMTHIRTHKIEYIKEKHIMAYNLANKRENNN